MHKSQLNGNESLCEKLETSIGKRITLKLIEFGALPKATSFKALLPIEDLCTNKIPHIIIATYNGGKPVESNNITE